MIFKFVLIKDCDLYVAQGMVYDIGAQGDSLENLINRLHLTLWVELEAVEMHCGLLHQTPPGMIKELLPYRLGFVTIDSDQFWALDTPSPY